MQPIPTQTPAMIKPETHNEIVFLSTLFLVMDDEGGRGRGRVEEKGRLRISTIQRVLLVKLLNLVVLFLSKLI